MSEIALVGLGNPGREYGSHRHNVGARCLSAFARGQGIALDRREARCRVGGGEVEGMPVVLARPATFMNESGRAVAALVRKFDIPLSHLLVVCDDLDLPLGRVRLRPKGSAGGHRGLTSIIAALGSQAFPRLRVGVGRPPPGLTAADYVLSPFTPLETPLLERAVAQAGQAMLLFISQGLETAMSQMNRDQGLAGPTDSGSGRQLDFSPGFL